MAKIPEAKTVGVLLNDYLRVELIQEAFNCIIVHREDVEAKKIEVFQEELAVAFGALTPENKEIAVSQYLIKCANETNLSQLKLLLNTLAKLVGTSNLSARLVCEQILNCEKLSYHNQTFWLECFKLIRRIIGGVDYKGVREIMKGCREKSTSFPNHLSSSLLPQMMALFEVLEYIFNRNSCLLPAYFIITEIQKTEIVDVHWKIADLTANFVEEFVSVAQMLSIIGHSHMLPIVEHSGYADHHLINPWRLEPNTLKFTLKGNLPYEPELTQPQVKLLRHVLEEPYSRDMVCSMLNLQKQHKERCVALEEQLVELVISAMERSEQEQASGSNQDESTPSHSQWLWLHLSSQLIYFVLFQFATFPNIVTSLHEKLATRDLRKGRDHLMWVLLQFISGSIQRNPLSNFLPVLKLYDILYPEREPLQVPDFTKPSCTHQIAATCIWIHLLKKAQTEHINIRRPIPIALKMHHEFLHSLVVPNSTLSITTDYSIALLCNAYSTNQDYFSRPMSALIDGILGNTKAPQTGGNQPLPTVPLSMCVLDSLTVHSKMSLIHSIVTHMIKQAQTKSSVPNIGNMSPALVETYSRLLVYTEIESLGIKGFLSQLLPAVFKSNAWGILYTLLEMFSYRMHHIQPHYRVQLLSHLHSLASVPHTNQMQIHLCVESTALRLISGYTGSTELQIQLSRYLSEPKNPNSIVSVESEELNRLLILTLARSMHITGTGNDPIAGGWCKDLLSVIMQNTPHCWSEHTRSSFPTVIADFFSQQTYQRENKTLLKKTVEEEYRNYKTMTNDNDIINHFTNNQLFLCLLYKIILEGNGIPPVAYKILERIGARGLTAHLRKWCDFLVVEIASSGGSTNVSKYVDSINDMIWKYSVLTIDRLVLVLILRYHEINEAQVCFFIIQLLLLKTQEFRNRVQEFVKENSPEHWKQSNWHEKHMSFHQKFPEKFVPDEASTNPVLPVFFGNCCYRFLPILDIVIHRYLEVANSAVIKSLEVLLDILGLLYKFHDRPITYLYTTLHYYERKLRDRNSLKRKLIGSIVNSLKDVRQGNWALTEQYQQYIQTHVQDSSANSQMSNYVEMTVSWNPDITYYINLVRRLIDTIDGKNIFPPVDYRFNEFPNASTHALYVTCVELLGIPSSPTTTGNNLIDVVIKGYTIIPHQSIHKWINAIGLIMAAMPESYWSVVYDRLEEIIRLPAMQEWTMRHSPFDMFNFKTVKDAMLEKNYVIMLAISHSIFHHFGVGQTAKIVHYIKEKLKPHIRTEYQLIYLHHIVSPFLQRLDMEHKKDVLEITKIFYELLEQVDKHSGSKPLKYMDPICDLLYHSKYMFVGDVTDLEVIIRRLRPALQMRLRFITKLPSVDEPKVEKMDIGTTLKNQPTQQQKNFKI